MTNPIAGALKDSLSHHTQVQASHVALYTTSTQTAANHLLDQTMSGQIPINYSTATALTEFNNAVASTDANYNLLKDRAGTLVDAYNKIDKDGSFLDSLGVLVRADKYGMYKKSNAAAGDAAIFTALASDVQNTGTILNETVTDLEGATVALQALSSTMVDI